MSLHCNSAYFMRGLYFIQQIYVWFTFVIPYITFQMLLGKLFLNIFINYLYCSEIVAKLKFKWDLIRQFPSFSWTLSIPIAL